MGKVTCKSSALLCLLITALLFSVVRVCADPVSQFDEGLRHYRENNFQGAIDAWESIVRSGVASGETYFNLGNAYYRTGQVGRSILNYERAASRLTNDRDLQSNLVEVRRKTVDRIEPPLRLVIWKWTDTVRDSVTIRTIALWIEIISATLAVILIISRLLPLLSPYLMRKVAIALVCLLVLATGWYGWRYSADSVPRAVVLVEKTDAYSGPDESSQQVFSLHEGTTVQIEQVISSWLNIRLADGRQGWVNLADLERI